MSTTPNMTSREARKAQLIQDWGRHRNSHVEILSLYRRYTGNREELKAGTSVIEGILDAEFGPAASQETPETDTKETSEIETRSSENAA